jgi:hypothetical protein
MNSFTNEQHVDELAITAQDWAEYQAWLAAQDESNDGEWVDDYADEYEGDGQPDEYTEWQDYMGGDDWDHGQYDCDY